MALSPARYPLTLQFIRNRNVVPPDLEGWANVYMPDLGSEEFARRVVRRAQHKKIFQSYPDDPATKLSRRYLELRGGELNYFRAARGGAIQVCGELCAREMTD
jgi:hypothetical protein